MLLRRRSAKPAPGIAAIQLDRQGELVLLALAFRDPHGESTPPAMSTEPSFAILDSAGKEIYHGSFEFG